MIKFNFKHLFVFLFLAILICSIYSNTFYTSWHFDDLPNIVNNFYLHLKTLQPESIINSWYSNPSNPFQLNDKLYRPVACMSFALNWYFGQNNVFGYHLVNLTIHILTAFFLYLFIFHLFHSPNLLNKYKNKYFIALFSAALWAINPIQTQAVTYIIQRMTLLAAMFYILGLYSYIKARNYHSLSYKSILWLVSCLVSYLFAMGSKENAAIFPLALLIVEALFYQDIGQKKTQYILLWSTLGISLLFILLSSYYFLNGNTLSFLKGYLYRPFSLTERIFAEFRIIVFYLSQIFYPVPDQFSIAHDIVLSKSIFTPWTTIPSILFIISLISFGLFQIRKNPLISLSILFFFLNHIIESTVIPIELIFEHRNYLPSFFIFLPFVLFCNKLFIANKKKYLRYTMIAISMVIVAIIGNSTFVRNKIWIDEKTLWTDAMIKAPSSARPLNNVAIELAWGHQTAHPNRYDMALKLFEKALDKYQPTIYLKADVLGNMASVYSNNKQDYKKAISLYKKALETHPKNLKIRHDLVNTLILKSDFEEALKNANILIASNSNNEVYYNLKGLILLWLDNFEEALSSLKKAFEITPGRTNILVCMGCALNLKGDYKNAEILLLTAAKKSPKEIMILFYLIENSIRAGDKIKEKIYIDELFTFFELAKINSTISILPKQYGYPPVAVEMILPIINKNLNEKAVEAKN